MKIILNRKFLQRKSIRGLEQFKLENVKTIETKRTTRKTIREIKFIFCDNSNLFINGLENFEQFEQDMLDNLGANVTVKNRQEPIDFDHPAFYMFLGLVIGFSSVYSTKYLLTLDVSAMKAFLIVSFVYISSVVIYLFTQKPISKRYGAKKSNKFQF